MCINTPAKGAWGEVFFWEDLSTKAPFWRRAKTQNIFAQKKAAKKGEFFFVEFWINKKLEAAAAI